MSKNLDMKNYVYGTRVINEFLNSNHVYYDSLGRALPFKWQLKKWKWHTDKRWKNTNSCGNGLHFWLNGCGDYSATSITNNHIWLLVRAKKNEYVELDRGEKAKAKSLQIIDWGNINKIARLMRDLVPDKSTNFLSYNFCSDRNVTLGKWSSINVENTCNVTAEDNCMIRVGGFSNVKAGSYCTIKTEYNSRVECEDGCIVFVCDSSKVKAGYNSKVHFGKKEVIIGPTYCDKWLECDYRGNIILSKSKV